MNPSRLLASILVLVLAVVSIGTATAWFSDSATLRLEINAASDFDPDGHDKVWVCKLVGPPEDPWVKPGKNPIHVSVDSATAEEAFSDAHPSYIVTYGDVECERRPVDGPSFAPRIPETEKPDSVDEPDVDSTTPSTTTVATTTTAPEAGDQPSTTTTTTLPPETTTTTPPDTTTTTQPTTTTSDTGD